MISRERVISVIEHKKPDRMPIYGWLFNKEFSPKVAEKYGSIKNFEDKYEFDMVHLFPKIKTHKKEDIDELRKTKGEIEPEDLLQIPLADPNDESIYEFLKKDLEHYKVNRGRFAYVQTPGCFEWYSIYLSIENHLAYLLMYPDELKELYNRLADWTISYAQNCLDLGVDMIHISDDWGAQRGLMFSPEIWKDLIYPYHKKVSEAVKKMGGYLSLHSDGDVMPVLDGIVDIGFDVVHPFQASAGMDYDVFDKKYKNKFTILGGLDVQATLGFGRYDDLRSEITNVINRFKDGGMLFCTTHMVQPHCSIEELEFAYDLVRELINK